MKISYTLHVAGLTRILPILLLTENLSIASFVMLGDTDLVVHVFMSYLKYSIKSAML